MAGQQSQQITVGLYPDLVHLVGLDDLDICHGVGQLLPQVGHSHLIAYLQEVNMTEVVRTLPAPVSCNDGVGAVSANGDRCLPQHCRACGQMFVTGAQVDGHSG